MIASIDVQQRRGHRVARAAHPYARDGYPEVLRLGTPASTRAYGRERNFQRRLDPTRQIPSSREGASGRKQESARTTPQQVMLRKLGVIFSAAWRNVRAVEATSGVSGPRLWALIEMRDQPGMSVSDIAKRLWVHQSTASNPLETLDGKAMITRTRSGRDPRIVPIHLAPRGRSLLVKAPESARGVVPDTLTRLAAEGLKFLDREFGALVARMARQNRPGAPPCRISRRGRDAPCRVRSTKKKGAAATADSFKDADRSRQAKQIYAEER